MGFPFYNDINLANVLNSVTISAAQLHPIDLDSDEVLFSFLRISDFPTFRQTITQDMIDPGQPKRNQPQENAQLEEDEDQVVVQLKSSRLPSSINLQRLSRPESNLSLHAPRSTLSSRSSRAHIDYEGESYSTASSMRRKPKGTNGSLSSLGLPDSHVGLTPSGGSRQSLAFELAAAMDPTENDQSSILDSLGLGDDDEDGEEGYSQQEDEDEDTIDAYTIRQDEEGEAALHSEQRQRESWLETRSSGQAAVSSPGWKEGLESGSSSKFGIRGDGQATPTTRRTRRSPHSTTTGFSRRKPSFGYSMVDEYDAGAEDDVSEREAEPYESDHSEAVEEQAMRLLETGLVSTAHFLAILKHSNTDYIPPPTGLASSPQTAQSSFDRQPAVEKLIVDLVRTMTENVREREAQIRELKEIEVALSHTDRRALAEAEPLPMMLEDADFRTNIVGQVSGEADEIFPVVDQHHTEAELGVLDAHGLSEGRITPLAHHASVHNLLLVSTYSGNSPDTTRSLIGQQTPSLHSDAASRIISTGACPQASPMSQLNQLKLVTTSLINTLNLINEHTQIGRQTQTEVVRKLKGVRGLVTNWKADHESLEQSKEYIGRWESALGLDDPSAQKVRGRFEVQVKLATAEAEELLEEASHRARRLLLPEPIPV